MGDYARIADDGAAAEDLAAAGDGSAAKAAVAAAGDAFGQAEWAGDDKFGRSFKSALPPSVVSDLLGPPRIDGDGRPLNICGAIEATERLTAHIAEAHRVSLESDAEQAKYFASLQKPLASEG